MTVRVVRLPSSSQLDLYLTQSSASTTYLTQNSASITYAKISSPQFSGNVGIGVVGDSGSQLTLGRSSTTEGGQLGFSRGVDNSLSYYFDVFGSTTSPTFRLVDASASSVRMSVDSSGRITMPAVPAFNVYSSFVSTQSGNLTYNATNSNNGGHMNLGTGLFTAPVSGHYQFNYYGFIDTGLAGNTTITFQKNGAGFPSRGYNDFNDTAYGPVITLSAVIYLAANDNVRVNITGAGVHGNDSSFFSGFLIG